MRKLASLRRKNLPLSEAGAKDGAAFVIESHEKLRPSRIRAKHFHVQYTRVLISRLRRYLESVGGIYVESGDKKEKRDCEGGPLARWKETLHAVRSAPFNFLLIIRDYRNRLKYSR